MEGYVLIETEVGEAEAVAARVAGLEGVLFTEVVTGPYDVIARARRNCQHDLVHCLDEEILAIPRVTRALTCPVGSVLPIRSITREPTHPARVPTPA